jgi:hypothetical protein
MQRPRKPAKLSESTQRQLNMYALAATAAGVGVLALAEPADAKIIYTKANVKIHNHFILNLNRGRRGDFSFATRHSGGMVSGKFGLYVNPIGTKNRIWGTGGYASALAPGVRVESNTEKFSERHYLMWTWNGCMANSSGRGQWGDVTDGYLGLRFMIAGKVHYGWARLSVPWDGGLTKATLTGYAYETIPNKAIITGKTKEPDVIAVQPATLGHLAAGAAAIQAWRKESMGFAH